MCVCVYVCVWGGGRGVSLVPRPHPHGEEKRSGEPSRISWALVTV